MENAILTKILYSTDGTTVVWFVADRVPQITWQIVKLWSDIQVWGGCVYCESARTYGERLKEHLRAPSPIYDHDTITGHQISTDNFTNVGRESHNLITYLRVNIGVNDPSLNRNIGEYQLSQIPNNSTSSQLWLFSGIHSLVAIILCKPWLNMTWYNFSSILQWMAGVGTLR